MLEASDGVGGPEDFGERPWFGFPFSFWAKYGGPKGVFEGEGGGGACWVEWDWELVGGLEIGREKACWGCWGGIEEECGEGTLSTDAFEMGE